MRRPTDRRPSTLFRGSELARLMTMLIMLGVIAMLMSRARDPRTWRMFTGDDESKSSGRLTLAQVDAEAEKEKESKESAERGARSAEQQSKEAETSEKPAELENNAEESAKSGIAPAEHPQHEEFKPTDEDPDERDAIPAELEAITDKAPLTKEEMFAYRRMLKWSMNQTTAQMRKRAKSNIRLSELFQNPDKYRGKLLDIDVHIRQAMVDDDLPENELGLKRSFEVWGWNNSSQPYSYVLVCPAVPRDMPLGASLGEEGRFVGYFLKLMAYEDHEGKRRSAPLLVGRLAWDPSPEALQKAAGRAPTDWWIWIVGGGLLALLLLRRGTRLLAAPRVTRGSLPRPRTSESEAEVVPLETWLDQAEANQPGDAINHHAGDEIPGEEDRR